MHNSLPVSDILFRFISTNLLTNQAEGSKVEINQLVSVVTYPEIDELG